MAVVRFKLAAHEHRAVSKVLLRAGWTQAAKELERAAYRPGLTAELNAQEFRAMLELAAWPTEVARVFEEAEIALNRAVADETLRPRGTELGIAPHGSFHARRAAKLAKRDKGK